ncbi:MAG TPA: RNA polymerase sigma factor [Solirubrobacteraceae bacterium]|jgi:RNA polymerase sigma-70 factor (ECF subfamily)|nr:RNA polymerase sigma factor [Solirubrobacteraceae bacterium]
MLRIADRSDAELLAGTVDGATAFAAFYRRYEKRVLGYLRWRVNDPELVADLTSEVFARALEHAASFDVAKSGHDAGGWLFTIAHNALVSSIRRGTVADDARRRLGMLTPLVLDDEAFERVEAMCACDGEVVELLDELPTAQREAIMAHVLDERSYTEIAAELRCSSLVVRKRVSRGLATLRSQMEGTR